LAQSTIKVEPIAGALGAEISGIDLAQRLSDGAIGEIRQALLAHQVIFFRDQHLTPEQHLDFGRRFGELQIHEFVGGMAEYPEILEVRKEPDEARNFGGGWHTDVSYLERPALGSVLYALEVPEYGGDTMFASQYLAYEALSDGMKAVLDGMTAVHSARGLMDPTRHAPTNMVLRRCASISARRRTPRSSIQWCGPMSRRVARRFTSMPPLHCALKT
jgi:taurine dioxygenase